MLDLAALHIDEEEEFRADRRRAARVLAASTAAPDMLAAEYLGPFSEAHATAVLEFRNSALATNSSLNVTEAGFVPELFYRHSMAMTAVYCVAYLLVFAVGIVGNFFVIAVVFRSPRMRTVTNFFIVNLAVADILVIVFCLPATLMSNIFVRKYKGVDVSLGM
ncbi:hypothetical protein Zmor_027331 [Zophobas morio]|uniref:G-protein coupled receptors family 1 profile domain-containing protein n=1 Tax=Zophobas morio TaxID=2755281 RepID=A0AA38M1Z6_9CUCU|nr:hypothetical protein Zmor_027331 [Zophobas morio]